MSSYRYAALHLAFAVPLAILCLIAAHTITGGSLDSFLRVAAALPGQAVDERTGRYVLCLAIPFVLLPLTVAAWATLRIRRADPPGAGTILGVALVAGFAATILFWASIEVALAHVQGVPIQVGIHGRAEACESSFASRRRRAWRGLTARICGIG
jgi:hypothetical protein